MIAINLSSCYSVLNIIILSILMYRYNTLISHFLKEREILVRCKTYEIDKDNKFYCDSVSCGIVYFYS